MSTSVRIILLGPPGAGKGTQAARLTEKFGIVTISAGDLFRARVKDPNDPLGTEIKKILESGKLVPDEITIQMIAERLEKGDCKNGFILDGFPRSIAQADGLAKMLESKNLHLDSVIQLAVNDDRLVERIAGRYACGQCGEGYHDTFKKPRIENTCDHCRAVGQFTRRSDDNADTVRQRLETYYSQTAPILPYYKERGMLEIVDGMAEMDIVTAEIMQILAKKVPQVAVSGN